MVAAKNQQRDESEIERQRQGRQPYGCVPNAQLSGILAVVRSLRHPHLISGAVVKL
jgi:hypothetical protein